MVAVKDSGGSTIASFAYDGTGRRIAVTENSTTTDLYYSDEWQVLEERVGGTRVLVIGGHDDRTPRWHAARPDHVHAPVEQGEEPAR